MVCHVVGKWNPSLVPCLFLLTPRQLLQAGKAGLDVPSVGELILPLIGCGTQESGFYATPGQLTPSKGCRWSNKANTYGRAGPTPNLPCGEWVREDVEGGRAAPEVMRVADLALCPCPTSNSPEEIRGFTLPRHYNRADPSVRTQVSQTCSTCVRELLVSLPLYATGWQGWRKYTPSTLCHLQREEELALRGGR